MFNGDSASDNSEISEMSGESRHRVDLVINVFVPVFRHIEIECNSEDFNLLVLLLPFDRPPIIGDVRFIIKFASVSVGPRIFDDLRFIIVETEADGLDCCGFVVDGFLETMECDSYLLTVVGVLECRDIVIVKEYRVGIGCCFNSSIGIEI